MQKLKFDTIQEVIDEAMNYIWLNSDGQIVTDSQFERILKNSPSIDQEVFYSCIEDNIYEDEFRSCVGTEEEREIYVESIDWGMVLKDYKESTNVE